MVARLITQEEDVVSSTEARPNSHLLLLQRAHALHARTCQRPAARDRCRGRRRAPPSPASRHPASPSPAPSPGTAPARPAHMGLGLYGLGVQGSQQRRAEARDRLLLTAGLPCICSGAHRRGMDRQGPAMPQVLNTTTHNRLSIPMLTATQAQVAEAKQEVAWGARRGCAHAGARRCAR